MAALGCACLWPLHSQQNGLLVWAVSLPLFLFGVLGILACAFGCNRCVVRLYGSA